MSPVTGTGVPLSSGCILMKELDNLQRHFIDTFSSTAVLLKPLLLLFSDSIAFCEDCDALRNNFVLNPINQGAELSLPSNRQVR